MTTQLEDAQNQPSRKLRGFVQITRLDKPIGIYLLLWPTYWALWLASGGTPSLHLFIVFTLGVVVMRSAGCAVNDLADRNFDGMVKRTNQRPLVSGLLTVKEGIAIFIGLLAVALGLLLTLSLSTWPWAVVAAIIASAYPFMKRFTHFPQVVLGTAFSMGMPMAFVQIQGYVPELVWWLFIANLLWTVAYDTMYAMVDRDDDLQIGVKSTAIIFGRFDKVIVALLQLITLLILVYIGLNEGLSPIYYSGLGVAALFFLYQQWLIKDRVREYCFKAFLNNHYAGMFIFVGLALDLKLN